MYLANLAVGTAIHLDVEREGEKFSFPTRVENVKHEQLDVILPFYCGAPFMFREGDKVSVRYSEDSQLLRWKVDSWSFRQEEYVRLLELKITSRAESYNRRSAFRVVVNELIDFKPLVGDPVQVLLRDISLQGVGFTSENEFEVGDEFSCKLSTESGEIHLDFKIVRLVTPVGDQKEYRYGAAFTYSEERKLSKYISDKQRIELQRRRLKS